MIECHLYVPQHITGVNVRLSYKVYAAVIFAFHILSTVSGFYVLWIDNPHIIIFEMFRDTETDIWLQSLIFLRPRSSVRKTQILYPSVKLKPYTDMSDGTR